MITIDLERTRELLREAMLTQGPDFVYNPGGDGLCYNIPSTSAPEGSPVRLTGCLVGTMFTRLGVDLEGLNLTSSSSDWVVSILRDQKLYDFTDEAAFYLATVQKRQDAGFSWGEALTG